MESMVCNVCGKENTGSVYYCRECGSFLRGDQFETKGIGDESERKIKRIKDNLKEHPHTPIIWNETIDTYARKVEKIRSLLRIKDIGITSKELDQKMTDFLISCRKPDFQIAFVGTIKTGKSTLINSLLGHNYASMDVTPETAVLTKFRSSEKDHIRVTFYDQKEWKTLWQSVQKGADKFLEEYRTLNADQEKDKWIGHSQEYIEVANRDIEKELSVWSSSKSAVHYFVKEIEVGISTLPRDFPKQVVFVDTPGLSDPVEYRSKISREYIHKANAVFVCVDAAKIYREEIETIASVFSFSAHNKNKVHIIATHWDVLNDPVEDWKKQKRFMVEHLTGPAFFASREMAEKNIMYSAAYIYNLCRDYEVLDRRERRIVDIFPIKLDMESVYDGSTTSDLKKIMEICNIHKINQVIVDELVCKYSSLLYEDLGNAYNDIMYIVKREASEQKKELTERIVASNADIQVLEAKILEKKKDMDEIKRAQAQLKAALNSLEKHTDKRLKQIMAQLK